MTANTKNLLFCFWVELSTRFYFYMKSNLTIFILVKYITLKLAFMKKSHFWGRSVWISNSHNGRTKQNLAKIFYKLHFIHNMNIICENKQILRWSVFFFAEIDWFLEKQFLILWSHLVLSGGSDVPEFSYILAYIFSMCLKET